MITVVGIMLTRLENSFFKDRIALLYGTAYNHFSYAKGSRKWSLSEDKAEEKLDR